jgi:hypothetical protein
MYPLYIAPLLFTQTPGTLRLHCYLKQPLVIMLGVIKIITKDLFFLPIQSVSYVSNIC